MLYDFDLVPSVGISDQAPAIDAAIVSMWPAAVRLKCYPHIARKALTEPWGMGCEGKQLVAEVVEAMHLSRTKEEFRTVARLACGDLLSAKADKATVEAFEKQNCRPPNDTWYITASGQPGTVPSQNPQEAYNGSIKKGKIINLRASQVVFWHQNPKPNMHCLLPEQI